MCVCVFQEQPTIAAHSFKEGMKLEAVDPAAPISIRPATVTKVGGCSSQKHLKKKKITVTNKSYK